MTTVLGFGRDHPLKPARPVDDASEVASRRGSHSNSAATEEGIEGDPERQIRLYLLPLSGRGWPRQGEPWTGEEA